MVNPLGHWIQIMFGTRFRIPLRGLSGLWGIGFWIPLRGLSGLQVTPGSVVCSHPLLIPVCRYFEVYVSFLLLLNILFSLFYGDILGVFL